MDLRIHISHKTIDVACRLYFTHALNISSNDVESYNVNCVLGCVYDACTSSADLDYEMLTNATIQTTCAYLNDPQEQQEDANWNKTQRSIFDTRTTSWYEVMFMVSQDFIQ